MLTPNIIPLNPVKVKRKEVFCTDKFYSCKEIAERYHVTTETVWDWIRTKKLSAYKIGGLYRVKESDLITFEESNYVSVNKEVEANA